jgi:hypothetical protein
MKKIFFITIAIIIIFSSCGALKKGKLTRRYKSITLIENEDTINKYVNVFGYLVEKESAELQKPKTVFDLSPQAQAAIIREISNKETGTGKFITALTDSLAFRTIKKSDDIIDNTQVERRIVLSIINTSHIPADRISRIKIKLDFDSAEVKILSCDKLITAYQTLDLGKINYTSTQNAEVSGNATIGAGISATKVLNNQDTIGITAGTTAGFSGKLSANRSYSEEVLLKQRIVLLNTSLKKNQISFYQEGASGIDLTGNILADVKLDLVKKGVKIVYSFSGLKTENKFNDPSSIKVSKKTIIYPDLNKDVRVKIEFEADYRQVTKNRDHRTISESDDRVKLYYGNVINKDTLVIPYKILLPRLYKLSLVGDTKHAPVQINIPSIASGPLLFNSYKEAEDFLLWLKAKFKGKTDVKTDDQTLKEIVCGSNPSFIVAMPNTYTMQEIEIRPF